jgi:hypothetical protein
MSGVVSRLAIVGLLALSGCFRHGGGADELKPSPFYSSLSGAKLMEEAFAGLTIAPGAGSSVTANMNSVTGGFQKHEGYNSYSCTREQAVESMAKLHESARRLLTENKADVSDDATMDRAQPLPAFKLHYTWGNSTGDVTGTLTKSEDQSSAVKAENRDVYRVTLVVTETVSKPGS